MTVNTTRPRHGTTDAVVVGARGTGRDGAAMGWGRQGRSWWVCRTWGQASTAVVGAREPVAGGRGEPEGGKGVGEEQTTSKFLIGKVKGKEAK